MNTWKARMRRLTRDTEGAVAIIAAFILMALLGAASLAIDMGQLYVVRNNLQNTSDAAALAAAGNLINSQTGARDATAAQQAALTVAQRQRQLAGLPAVDPSARNDLTITFGEWNLKTGDPQTAWTEIGPTCASNSNANAIRVTLRRGCGTIIGPVSNLFASIFGVNTTEVAASATAYLGYTMQTAPQVPLALPPSILAASNGCTGWFARLFGPEEAVASATKTIVFRDTGGGYVNTNVTSASPLDPNQAYLFTVGQNDAVPGTIWTILEKIYTPSKTGTILYVGELKIGQQVYPRSEFKYGNDYIGPIFQRLKYAYNYKTTGNKNTAPPANTAWRTTLAVYGTTQLSQHRKTGFLSLARLLAPFWPSEAYACYTMPPPTTYIRTFVNADITGVTYSASGDEGSYTFPKTISTPPPASGSTTYTNKKDFLERYPNSVWNVNTLTVKNVTDASTVSPPGSLSGGPANQDINSGAPANVGALASIPRLVK